MLHGHREVAEQQQEDEQVVERQRALDEVDRRVRDRAVGVRDQPHDRRGRERDDEPADRPRDALAERRLTPAGEQLEVDRQERDGHRRERDPRRHQTKKKTIASTT
jgi:hypothetical protein